MITRRLISVIFLTFLSAYLVRCARQGHPSGGPKDTTPPEVISEIPQNKTVNFRSEKIQIKFNEFITLDNPLQKIIISPPLNKPPEIKPSGYPDKKIQIKFKENLRPNTTYTIYFNDAVKDFREGNPMKDYKYVFSTGNQLDSLSLKGTLKPAYDFKQPEDIIVALYPARTFSDSLLLNAKPYYLARADNNGNFVFENLAPGNYKIFAFSDKNKSLNYQKGEEHIAFLSQTIRIPQTKEVHLVMFKEKIPVKIEDISQQTQHKWTVKLSAPTDSLKVEVKNKIIKYYTINKHLSLWIRNIRKNDTLRFTVTLHHDTLFTGTRVASKSKKDTLLFKFNKNKLFPIDTLKLYPTVPLAAIDQDKIIIKPSAPFKTKISPDGSLLLTIPYKDQTPEYNLQIYPGALKDFLGHINKDTIKHKFSFESSRKTGNLKIVLEKHTSNRPIIVELYNQEKKRTERMLHTTEHTFEFPYLPPGKYRLRIIVDENKNGKWDTGNLLLGKQPEPVYIHPAIIEIRPYWDLEEKIPLKLD